jgi:hypothetical protein
MPHGGNYIKKGPKRTTYKYKAWPFYINERIIN